MRLFPHPVSVPRLLGHLPILQSRFRHEAAAICESEGLSQPANPFPLIPYLQMPWLWYSRTPWDFCPPPLSPCPARCWRTSRAGFFWSPYWSSALAEFVFFFVRSEPNTNPQTSICKQTREAPHEACAQQDPTMPMSPKMLDGIRAGRKNALLMTHPAQCGPTRLAATPRRRSGKHQPQLSQNGFRNISSGPLTRILQQHVSLCAFHQLFAQ